MDCALLTQKLTPGKVFGNIYFAGIRCASTHIIDTDAGLIVLDPGMPDTLEIVLSNMQALGFHPADIKIILLSHGHYDHAGTAKELRELTGAKIYLGAGDLNMVTGAEDTALAHKASYIKKCSFTPDVLLCDGDVITLGNTSIRCVATPGHTDGTMSFFFPTSDGKKTLIAGMHGGVGVNTLTTEFLRTHGLPFSNRQVYIESLQKVRDEQVDVFLGNHVPNNNTVGKLALVRGGNPDAFVCPGEWRRFIDGLIAAMQKMIDATAARNAAADKLINAGAVTVLSAANTAELENIPAGSAVAVSFAGGQEAQAAAYLRETAGRLGETCIVGGADICNKHQAELVKAAGGTFIVSPYVDVPVIGRAKALELLTLPCAYTPTEAYSAYYAGADLLAVYPAQSALRAMPLPAMRIAPADKA